MTGASGKEIEEIDNAHVICLINRLLTSSGDSDDLSVGFNGSIEALETKLTNIEAAKGNYYVRVYLKDVFGFAEHQDNCTYGLGYKLTFQTYSANHVINHPPIAKDVGNLSLAGRVFLNDISWYVLHYTPSISNQIFLLGQIVSRAARNY